MSTFFGSLMRLSPGKLLASTATLLALLQGPAMSVAAPILPSTAEAATNTPSSIVNTTNLPALFFGPSTSATDEAATISKEMSYVSSRGAYPAALGVVEQYQSLIKAKADKYGVPEDVALGVALLENGGSTVAKSPAGALGIFQLMPSTARSLGLTVNSKTDERTDPATNIDAGVRLLAENYSILGDWGLATWAYHAGAGNVRKALKLYDAAHPGASTPTVDELLSDQSVQRFAQKLDDDSAGYPYKVLATAVLFRKASA